MRVANVLLKSVKRGRLQQAEEEDAEKLAAWESIDSVGSVGETSDSSNLVTLEQPICSFCLMYRKLAFRDGVKCRELCPCDRKAKRRRLNGKQADKWGLFRQEQEAVAVQRHQAKGHLLFIYARAGITWCMSCGAFTSTHVKHLGQNCDGKPGKGKAVVCRRLRRGLHPTKGHSLEEQAVRVTVE